MSNSKRLVEIAVKSSTKDAERGLGKVASAFKNIKAEHALMAGAIAAGAVAIIATLKKTAEAAFDLAEQMAKVGDSFDKMSKRTSLSVTTLSEWSYITQRAGADVGALERGVSRMIVSMRDYQEGTATAMRAWDDLGVSVTNADGSLRKVDDVLYDAREALSKMGNESEAAALAQELFGRGGKALLPVLRLSSEEFKAQADRVKALGGVYDTSVTDSAARFIDAQLDIKTAVEGVKMKLAEAYTEETARAMEAIADSIARIGAAALENTDEIEKMAKSMADLVEKTADYSKVIAALIPVLHNFGQIQAFAAGANYTQAVRQVDDLASAIGNLVTALGEVGQTVNPNTSTVFTEAGRDWLSGGMNTMPAPTGAPAARIAAAPVLPRDNSMAGGDWNPAAYGSRGQGHGVDASMLMDIPVTEDPNLALITDEDVDRWERMKEASQEFSDAMSDNLAGLTDQMAGLAAQGITSMLGLRNGAFDFGAAIKSVAIQALEEMIRKLIMIKILKGAFGIPFLANGGTVPGYKDGGIMRAAAGMVIPPIAQAGQDSVMIAAMPGEGVIKRDTMLKLDSFLNASANAASVAPGSAGGDRMVAQINYNISRPVSYRDHVEMGRASAQAMRHVLNGEL